ncbi:unnamed protein product [Thelazia callipaeda]|uniref:PPM-type phosphatase domain-containing protein n=1 Tax=Thelazia callipaeda TaxID=103827 RepID=A0A0N5D1G2_THECL|nr:unnamed protein product [Thelazia callipaeda]
MAMKRRMVPPLMISLYRDLDGGLDGAEKPETSSDEHASKSEPDPSERKRMREESALSEHSVETSADDGAVSTLVSVCGWRKGERQDMQDAHVRLDQFELTSIRNIQRSAFYAIFDGHAGRRAADFAAEHLPPLIKKKLLYCSDVDALERGIKKCFVDSYKQVDERFLIEARRTRPSWKDGTTATTILLVNSVIYCANIGDSKAVVCRNKSENNEVKNIALQLTVDHSPLHFEERMRIQKAGGKVKDGRIMGILEVSRSIGDGQFKAYGLVCTPDVKKFSITKNDMLVLRSGNGLNIFLLIACDGLWKTFSNQEAVDYVTERLKQPRKRDDAEEETREIVWKNIADDLAAESVKRGCGDNVSVIIVVLNDLLDFIAK